MSPTKKLISDLTDKSANYTLKVKVVQKWRATYSPKKTKYQRYIMQDEKGEEISATVFGDDVEMYDKNVQQNREYEISNAKLRPVREEYKKKPNELEMQFTPYTVIRPLFVEDGSTSVVNYVDLSSIAVDFDNKDLYDVVGVILYLEPNRSIEKRNGSGQVDVRELVLLDHSVTHPVTITVWGDLARDECQHLSAAIESASVIGVTSLRVSSFKGFSLATSLSTHFIPDPTGEKAIALSKWAAANTELLSLKRQTILEARLSKLHPKLLNVAQLNQKKMRGLPEQTATKRSRGHRKSRAMQLQQQAAQLQEQCQDAHTSSLPANLHDVASIYSGACANTHYAHDQNIEVSLTDAGMRKKRKKKPVGTETDTSGHNDPASKNDQSQLTSFNNQAQKNDPIALRVDSVPTAPLKLAEYNLCQHCDAKLFQYEPLTFCCRRGSVKIANNPMNDEIIRLLTMDSEDAIHFRKFIRLYNNVFAFSSLGGNHDGKAEKGIYVFQLQGQLYHYVPDLKPKDGEPPKYLQLYFYDAQNELQNRAAAVQELRHDIVAVLIDVLKENPYAQFFKSLQALVIEDSTQIVINHSAVPDQRTYNAPTSDEVAGIWVDTSSSTGAVGPHILVHGKSNCSHRIKHYYGCYDPLQYPLIFPLGECGWHPGLKKVTQNVRVLRMPAVEGTTEAAHPDIERAAISDQPLFELAGS